MTWQLVDKIKGSDGEDGQQGPAGAKGDTGDAGPGVAAGGTTGQVLAKKTNTSYDTEWVDAAAGGGGISDAPSDANYYARHAAAWSALGSAALAASGDFATAAQGANGATAYNWGNHASAGYLTSVTYGTTAGTACQGNDARLSDARTPTSHTHAYLSSSDVDDTPENGATTAPVSSNWAYDHVVAAVPHANQLDAAEIVLSTPSATVTAGSKLAILTIPYAHQLNSVHFGCDAESKGSGSAIYDFNVLDSSGAATSVLTGTVTVTSSDSLVAGTLNGTVTGAANTAYSVDCDQASTGKGVKCLVTFKRTA